MAAEARQLCQEQNTITEMRFKYKIYHKIDANENIPALIYRTGRQNTAPLQGLFAIDRYIQCAPSMKTKWRPISRETFSGITITNCS